MKKYFEEWNGKKFPVREVMLPEELGGFAAKIADVELYDAVDTAYYYSSNPLHKKAVEIDDNIHFYCENGFIASDPTDKEIIDYLIKHGC